VPTISAMDRELARKQKREYAERRLAAAKAKGKHQVSFILPVEGIAALDEVKDAHGYNNRGDALSFVLGVLRENMNVRKELGLMTP